MAVTPAAPTCFDKLLGLRVKHKVEAGEGSVSQQGRRQAAEQSCKQSRYTVIGWYAHDPR